MLYFGYEDNQNHKYTHIPEVCYDLACDTAYVFVWVTEKLEKFWSHSFSNVTEIDYVYQIEQDGKAVERNEQKINNSLQPFLENGLWRQTVENDLRYIKVGQNYQIEPKANQ